MNSNDIINILDSIKDPEIPVISIVELGIIRKVDVIDNKVKVVITPTYSGCPAMTEIKNDIEKKLIHNGIKEFEISTVLSPAWTTDWMSEETKQKLRNYGIAPPDKVADGNNIFKIILQDKKIACPFCNSENTVKKSEFGSTACKSLFYCNNCHQPFEHFKCH